MSDPLRNRAVGQLEAALGVPVDDAELTDDTPLNTLGFDSLLVIGALVGLAEDYGVDLTAYTDTLAAPRTFGDLLVISEQFQADRQGGGGPS